MPGDGALGQEQRVGHPLVGAALGHQHEHLRLSGGEAGRQPGLGRDHAEPVEGFPREGERPGSFLVVAASVAGLREQQPGGGHLVRHLQLVPPLEGASQGRPGDRALRPRQLQAAARRQRARAEQRAAVIGGDLLQLGRCLLSGIEIACCHGDLHPGGQQLPAGERVPALLLEQPGDEGRRRLQPALGQPEHREPCALLTRERLGAGERLLRPRQVAEPSSYLSHFDPAGSDVGQVEAVELLAGPSRLALRRRPVAAVLQQRCVVHAADAGPHGERMLLRPAQRRVRPLRCPAEIAELLAGADHAAQHLARAVGRQPALDRAQHRLVEVAQALVEVSRVDEHPAERLLRLGLEIGRMQPACEGEHVLRLRLRAREISGAMRHLDLAQDQRAQLDALALVLQCPARPP